MGKRRKFTPEYRRDAASMVIDTGSTIAQIARDLGIGEQLLGRWSRLSGFADKHTTLEATILVFKH